MNEITPAPERWLPVPTWEGYYEVSDFGRVRSLDRMVRGRGSSMRLNPGRVLRPSYSNTGGYPMVILQLGDRREGAMIHQLVALVFIGERPVGQEVRHLDGDASSAALRDADGVQRLAYGTSGQNKADQVQHGIHYEGSRTHCDNGHEFTGANTRVDYRPDGSFRQRVCRACTNDRVKTFREQQAENGPTCGNGCLSPVIAKGLCGTCYARQWRAERKRKAAAA